MHPTKTDASIGARQAFHLTARHLTSRMRYLTQLLDRRL